MIIKFLQITVFTLFIKDIIRLQPTIIWWDYEIVLNILIVYKLNIKCIFIYIVVPII